MAMARAQGGLQVVVNAAGVVAADDPEGLAAFTDEMRKSIAPPVRLVELDAHINDKAFTDQVLAIFDEWVAAGHIVAGAERA